MSLGRWWLARYGFATLVAIAAVASGSIPVVGKGLVGTILFAVMLSAWYGGRGPGLLTTTLILLIAVVPMVRGQEPVGPSQIASMAMFVALGVSITLIVGSLQAARRRAENGEKWLSAVLTSIGDAVIVTDRSGDVAFLNPVAQGLTGWAEAEAVGRPLNDVFRISCEDTSQPAPSPVERVLREGVVIGLANHTILTSRHGGQCPIDDSAAPIRGPEGVISGVVLVFRDVTERRRREAERAELLAREQQAHAEAEAANHAKDHFLAVLSHELRTPLTPVLLMVTVLLDDPDVPPAIRSILEMTRHNLELEARLIDDLLDLTRIIRGKLRMNREVVDVNGLIQRAVAICREEIQQARIELELDLAASRRHVEGDGARLHQVLWNLIKNAVKFSPAGGRLSIATRNEDDGPPGPPGETLVIEVSDTGMGIDPDLLPRIFDAFEQGGSSSGAPRSGGLGLGLAISRSIVEGHGGQLAAASPGPDQGATFTLRLTTVPAPEPASAAASPSPGLTPSRALTLLVVEDDETTLRILTRLLRRRGHRVVSASTLAAALEIAASAEFDLVISDIGLPDGDGLELMRQIRSRRDVRGIALSGFGMEEDLRRSREAGFVEHLTKPIDLARLEASIVRIAGTPRE